MRICDFDFELPDELIAQHPLERRDASRMLVVERAAGAWRDGRFAGFASELRERPVAPTTLRAFDDKHPRRVAPLQRMLRDQLLR